MPATQKGTTLLISFGSFLYTGYIAEDVTVSYPDGNAEIIKNADGATITKIFMDPSTKIDTTVIILSTGSADPPKDNQAVGIIPPKGTLTTFMSLGSTAKHGAGATRLSLGLILEDSMVGKYT